MTMKAYCAQVTDINVCIIVFAESANKAKSTALSFEPYGDCKYTDIRVKRIPELDRFYSGNPYTDYWQDLEVRKILIEKFGWYCLYPFREECERCQLCEEYERIKEEMENDD